MRLAGGDVPLVPNVPLVPVLLASRGLVGITYILSNNMLHIVNRTIYCTYFTVIYQVNPKIWKGLLGSLGKSV